MADLLNSNARKGIKTMAKVAWTAHAVSQIPQPRDFALMITSDIIAFAGRVQELSDRMNSLLETYTDIPIDFIAGQMNSILDSAVLAIDKASNYSRGSIAINTGLASDIGGLIKAHVDLYAETSDLVIQTSRNIQNSIDIITDKDGLDSSLNNSVAHIRRTDMDGLYDATDALNDTNVYVSNKARGTGSTIKRAAAKKAEEMRKFQAKVNDLLNMLREQVKAFSKSIDDAFGVTTIKSTATNSSTINLTRFDNNTGNYIEDMNGTLIKETAKTTYGILDNFSIGKFVTGCAGITATATLMETGIMNLPPINVEMMLNEINGKQRDTNIDSQVDDLVQYDDTNYKDYRDSFEDILKKQRNEIRLNLANKGRKTSIMNEQKDLSSNLTDKERESAIKNIRSQRRKARRGKIANNVKNILLEELRRFVADMKAFSKSVRTRWENMMKTYSDTVKQVKGFFTEGGHGDKIIEDICIEINDNFDDIVRLCTQELPVQIANVSVDAVMPRAFGWCCTNFAQHVVQFFAECKVIIKFIMDLLRYVTNIVKCIKKLVNIIFSGINNILEIMRQLKELVNFKWIINLLYKIRSLFAESVENAVYTLSQTLQPVYYKDTDEYKEKMDIIEKLCSGETDSETLSSTQIYDFADKINCDRSLAIKMYNGEDDDSIEDYINEVEESGEEVIAYRALKFVSQNDNNSKNLIENEDELKVSLDNFTLSMPRVNSYEYFHADLTHRSKNEFKWGTIFNFFNSDKIAEKRQKRKGLFIKNASKKTNGRDLLNDKTLYKNAVNQKRVSRYDAFFWYKKEVTDDDFMFDEPILDATDGATYKSQSAHIKLNSENGSVVTVDLGNGEVQKLFIKDANVKSGDYVNYNGKKYKIK